MSFPANYTNFRFTPYLLNYVYHGQVYTSFHHVTTIASGTSFYLILNTNNRLHHAISKTIRTSGSGDLQISIWENATITTPGSAIDLPSSSLDRRVGNLNPAQSVITHTPTGLNLTGATLISKTYQYSNAQGSNVGNTDFSVNDLERIYDKNKTIVMQLEAVGNSLALTFNYVWYESGN